jgi:hypothetical protein
MKLELLEIEKTAGIGNTRNRLIWHVQPIQSANPVRMFLPYGFHLSAVRLAIHKDAEYDLTDTSWARK